MGIPDIRIAVHHHRCATDLPDGRGPTAGSAVFFGTNGGEKVFVSWYFARCLAGFFLGVVMCHWFRQLRNVSLHRSMMTMAEVATFGSILLLAAFSQGWSSWIHVLTPACVMVFAFDRGLVSDLLRSRPLRFLGVISYSIYMVHFIVPGLTRIVMNLLRDRGGIDLWLPGSSGSVYGRSPFESAVFMAIFLLITIAMSYLTYRWIEVPGRQWSRSLVDRLSRRKTRALVPVAGA